MKKKSLIILIFIIVILTGIQFIPSDKPEVSKDNPNDLIVNNEIPDQIQTILKNTCYDCHSDETNYPWYTRIYPIKVLVYKDVKMGREELNFSDWENFKKIKKATLLDDISSEVDAGEMPMKIYTLMHSKAKLDDEQKSALTTWAEAFAEKLFE